MKKLILSLMLIFSLFIFGDEYEKSYGEKITDTIKFGMTKQEFGKVINKQPLSNSHDEGDYAVYYFSDVKDPMGVERQFNSFNFVNGRLVSVIFDSQTSDEEHEKIIKMYENNQSKLSKSKMTKIEKKGRILFYNDKKTIEIERVLDHTFIIVQTARAEAVKNKIERMNAE